jgi:hypothetical protein
MKKNLKRLLVSGFLSVLVIAGLMVSNKSTAQGIQESASGHGTLLVPNEDGDIVRRQFSFNAKRHSDGTVTGQAVLHNPAFEGANGNKYQAKFDISCMQIVGNIAVLGGFVRRTNDPNLVDAAYFSVEDNGEPGKNNDRISSVFFFDDDPNTTGDPQGCLDIGPTDLPLNPIDAGNIQVRP